MNARRKLPDCDAPRAITHDTLRANGLGVPASSRSACRKNAAMSLKAANPMPSTYGSLAVNTTWYSSFGSNPCFKQIRVASGVPGKGFAVEHRAHAQSLDGIVIVDPIFPSIVSDACVVSVAFVVSSVCG